MGRVALKYSAAVSNSLRNVQALIVVDMCETTRWLSNDIFAVTGQNVSRLTEDVD
jgi:hypothetical protein